MDAQDRLSPGQFAATLVALAAAAIAPLSFVSAAAGFFTLHELALRAVLPAAAVIVFLGFLAAGRGWRRLLRAVLVAAGAGFVATGGLEIVRVIGLHAFGAMPGSMPMEMGHLLTGSVSPLFTDITGWAYHFWNGISFALIYALLFGRRTWWTGLPYAYVIATVFMVSPAMGAMGAGDFGQQFAPVAFPLTVYLAHTAFGALLGWVVSRSYLPGPALWQYLPGGGPREVGGHQAHETR